MRTWFSRSGEGISNSSQCGTKKLLPPFVENYYSDPQYKFGNQSVKVGKICLQMGFVTRFLNGASQEIKVKFNEGRLLKFYQTKQLKENSTENSVEKDFKEDSQFNELWNISIKQKRNEKYSNSMNFVSWTFSQISSSELHWNLQHFIFSIPFFLVSLYKIHLKKKLYCLCYLFEPVSELESCGTYCLNLPFNIAL